MTFRTINQDKLLASALTQVAKDEASVWEEMSRKVHPGRILEIGCGNGQLLSFLARKNPKSLVAGMDFSSYLLNGEQNKAIINPNVLLIKGDAIDPPFPQKSFDTIVLNKAVHEIWAVYGRSGTIKALKHTYNLLKDNGILIIRENTRPNPHPIKMKFESNDRKKLFWKFCAQFQPRNILWQEVNDNEVKLDIGDALEFLTKMDDPNWEAEMIEPHFTFIQEEWQEVLGEIGFQRVLDQIDEWTPTPKFRGVSLDFNIPKFKTLIYAYK
jgi:SAM-dependent methyltransferase